MGFARIPRLVALPFVQVLLLNACGDGSAQVPSSYSIDGTVSGLNSGSRVVLQNNGGSNITVSNNGMFSFPAQSYTPEYSVTVLTQSTGQTCTVISGTGTVVSAKVSNVRIVCGPATESVLYSFRGGIDGALPNGLIQGRDGNFYGTTLEGGGSGDAGTLFKVTPTGVEKVLYSFQNSSNGGQPVDGVYPTTGLIQGSDGNFYGTTSQGGGDGNLGTVFKVTPEGVETVLYSFASLPTFDQDLSAQVTSVLPSALIQGSDGNYYGTTTGGGEIGVVVGGEVFPPGKCCASFGTVFRVTPEGVETVVYSFLGGVDGDFPVGGLIQGSDGNFYGTTSLGGGSANAGTVFKVTTNGVETVLYSFHGGLDGTSPNGLIQGSDGNLYGTTFDGGSEGNGTVFKF